MSTLVKHIAYDSTPLKFNNIATEKNGGLSCKDDPASYCFFFCHFSGAMMSVKLWDQVYLGQTFPRNSETVSQKMTVTSFHQKSNGTLPTDPKKVRF